MKFISAMMLTLGTGAALMSAAVSPVAGIQEKKRQIQTLHSHKTIKRPKLQKFNLFYHKNLMELSKSSLLKKILKAQSALLIREIFCF